MERRGKKADQSKEAGSTSHSVWGRGQSFLRKYIEGFGSGNSLDKDTNDHLKFQYLNADEYEKINNEILDFILV
jgi:hypothetical protein